MFARFMAEQFARPRGAFGRWCLAKQMNALNAAMNELTFEMTCPTAGDRILEIGFGGGALLRRLHAVGAQVVGADYSQVMTDRMKAQIAAAGLTAEIQLYCADAAQMPFASGVFNKVCTVNTIYFWPDLGKPLLEIHRVLSAAGEVVLCFNSPSELRKWKGSRYGFALYELTDVEKALRASGFEVADEASRIDPSQGVFTCIKAVKTGDPPTSATAPSRGRSRLSAD